MNWLRSFLTWLLSLLPYWMRRHFVRLELKQAPFKYQPVDDLPDSLDPAKVYVAGEGENAWAAAMICPCGCGDKIELNLLKAVRPCWSAQTHQDGSVTLTPSVWRQKGCRSHFILSRGLILWC